MVRAGEMNLETAILKSLLKATARTLALSALLVGGATIVPASASEMLSVMGSVTLPGPDEPVANDQASSNGQTPGQEQNFAQAQPPAQDPGQLVQAPSGPPTYRDSPRPGSSDRPAPGQGAARDTGGEPPPYQGSEGQQTISDPMSGFNEAMFWFNRKLDDYALRPVATGYSYIAPVPVRQSVGNFFNNIGFIPRVANNLFQLRPVAASGELGRFGINTTLGVAGFFDVADSWFGMKQQYQDFGLTLGHYGMGTGPYLMLPFFGPSSIRDGVGLAVDGAMNPMSYLLPFIVSFSATAGWRVGEAVNYRSLNLELFQDADRYAIDLYGAVQDAYLQRRTQQLNQ
jgi:phospholipid-binding lipoprotein MlaA